MELIDWYIIEKAILTTEPEKQKSTDEFVRSYYGTHALVFVRRMRGLVREAD